MRQKDPKEEENENAYATRSTSRALAGKRKN
jgi:hypothetical protein